MESFALTGGQRARTVRQRARRVAPFLAGVVLAVALLPIAGEVQWRPAVGAMAVLVALVGTVLWVPGLTDGRASSAMAVVGLVAVVLLRDSAGGSRGGYGVLVTLPVLWASLYGTRRDLVVVLTGVAAALVVPLLVVGAPNYPATGWRSSPLLLLCCIVIGAVVQGLLGRERRSAAQRARLLAAIGDGVIVTTAHGCVLEVNPAFCSMFGWTAAELVGTSVPLPPWPVADHRALLIAHQEAIEAGGAEFEARFNRRDGSPVDVLITLAVDPDATTDAAIIATVKDVTERTRAAREIRVSSDRSTAILTTMSDGYLLSRDGVLLDVNPALCEITGFSRQQLLGRRRPYPFWPPELTAELHAVGTQIVQQGGGERQVTLMRADGSRFCAETRNTPVTDGLGIPGALLTTLRDVTERQHAEDAARAHGQELAALAKVTRAVAHADPARARETVCAMALDITDATAATIWEADPHGVLHNTCILGAPAPDFALDRAATNSGARRTLDTGKALFIEDVTQSASADPRMYRLMNCTSAHFQPLTANGRPTGVLALTWTQRRPPLSDTETHLVELLTHEASMAIERAARQAELEHLARTDALTGLPNRRTLEEASRREVAFARRTSQPLTLAILDLDHFKTYNDTHGHPAGDQLLRTISHNWQDRLRETDVLARWGGEEFCLLLPACDLQNAHAIIDALRHRTPNQQTFSAGLAAWHPGLTSQDWIQHADQALYNAKRQGRNRTVEASPPNPPSSTRTAAPRPMPAAH